MGHDDYEGAFPSAMTANLHLGSERSAVALDIGRLGVLSLGDRSSAELSVFADTGAVARSVAEAASSWAELTEARERGEEVALWGSWVVPADTFGGER